MKVDMLGFHPAFSYLVAPWGELDLLSKNSFYCMPTQVSLTPCSA